MAGHFELVPEPNKEFRVELVDGRGNVIATSIPFKDSIAAVAAISAFRTMAAGAPIRDSTGAAPGPRTRKPHQ
ncbi:DUF1508 domain-containing protein [Pseudarthrobacter enclensis]|uniref:DUF1508 domain-containing protein n=1 Tax=Pseudarthrobacter enclensis TaxID=993070 RepID=UPI00368C392E